MGNFTPRSRRFQARHVFCSALTFHAPGLVATLCGFQVSETAF